jgi:tripartite-type tricarboxylate transporter receptor subunit TctC
MTLTARRGAVTGIMLALCASVPAAADEVADFYKRQTVSIVVAHEVGTGFDIYARVLARHLSRHVPGNPSVVVQNMVGASGIAAANWLYNVAPKDGTVMATFVHTVPFEPLFGNGAAKYDPAKLVWIGNMEESVGTCGVSTASGISTFDELREKEVVFGATGATGPLGKFALAVKNLLGAKIRLVYGYKGSASVKRSAELPGVPHVDDYAKTEEDRQLFALIFAAQALGRIYASPPDMPRERMEALRRAFMATMEDKQFLTEAKSTQIDIVPNTGEEVAALIARYSATSKPIVERAKRAFDPN